MKLQTYLSNSLQWSKALRLGRSKHPPQSSRAWVYVISLLDVISNLANSLQSNPTLVNILFLPFFLPLPSHHDNRLLKRKLVGSQLGTGGLEFANVRRFFFF